MNIQRAVEILQDITESREAVRYKLVGMVWSSGEERSQGIDAGMLCLLRVAIPEAYGSVNQVGEGYVGLHRDPCQRTTDTFFHYPSRTERRTI